MTITAAVLSGFAVAILAPWLYRRAGRYTGWILALLPLAIAGYFVSLTPLMAAGEVIQVRYSWVPSLGVNLSFDVDGLSLLFVVIISGVGALILIYAGGYLAGHPLLGRFYAYILMFMASMLGVVLSGNLVTLFIFWELTSFTSYLLIGFDHEREEARFSALQALLVTGGGGLALLMGLLIMGGVGGSLELTELLARGDEIRAHGLYLPLLLLILAGAFTKSAQVPFHFWLPNAMEAPTPVSAYLHSATMVKAGVYLIARLSPILGGTDSWYYLVAGVGCATMLVGAYLALRHTDLKRILAYSTVSSLGTLVFLLGLGTKLAVEAAAVFLIAHALYKGALFLTAGAVDHEAGTRDVRRLGGLSRLMPVTTAAVSISALSMAGIPPLFGFISKELVYEATLQLPARGTALTLAALLTNMVLVAVAAIIVFRPFFGPRTETPKKAHEAPPSMIVGPVLLGGLGLLIGVLPGVVSSGLIVPCVSAVLAQWTPVKLTLWHGLNPALALSAATLAGGLGIYGLRQAITRITEVVDTSERWGPAHMYTRSLDWLYSLAGFQTRLLQSGYLRHYLTIIIVTMVSLTAYTLIARTDVLVHVKWPVVRFYELVAALVVLLAAVAAVGFTSRLAAIAALGVVGYGAALIYVLFGAPDLAMTQVLIETLAVVLLVLVLYRLPRFVRYSNLRTRVRDALVALAAGGLMTALVLIAVDLPYESHLKPFFAEHSYHLAKGRNIVNVILVDFRALDTLGEITVIAIAAVGVYALLKLRMD